MIVSMASLRPWAACTNKFIVNPESWVCCTSRSSHSSDEQYFTAIQVTNDISPTPFHMKDIDENGRNGNAHHPTSKRNWTSCIGQSYLHQKQVFDRKSHFSCSQWHILYCSLAALQAIHHHRTWRCSSVQCRGFLKRESNTDAVVCPLLPPMEIGVSISCWADHGWIRTSRCHLLQSLRIMWMSFNLYQGYWQEG